MDALSNTACIGVQWGESELPHRNGRSDDLFYQGVHGDFVHWMEVIDVCRDSALILSHSQGVTCEETHLAFSCDMSTSHGIH